MNYLPSKFNGDILFELPPIQHPLGQFEKLQGMDRKFNVHVWCKLQTSNTKNSLGQAFKMTKCLGHLCYQNDFFLCFNVLLCAMKFLGVGIVHNF
jgi:hypothetical protein